MNLSRVASSTGGVEAVLAHHQDALGAQRELGVQPQVAEQIGDDRAPGSGRCSDARYLAAGRIGKVAAT